MRTHLLAMLTGIFGLLSLTACPTAEPQPAPVVDAGVVDPCPKDAVVLEASPGWGSATPVTLHEGCQTPVVFKGAGLWAIPDGVVFIPESGAATCSAASVFAGDGGAVADAGAGTAQRTWVASFRRAADGGVAPTTGKLLPAVSGPALFGGLGYTLRSEEVPTLVSGEKLSEYAPGSTRLAYTFQTTGGKVDFKVSAPGRDVELVIILGPGSTLSFPGTGGVNTWVDGFAAGALDFEIRDTTATCDAATTTALLAPDVNALPASYTYPVELTVTQL